MRVEFEIMNLSWDNFAIVKSRPSRTVGEYSWAA